MPVGYIVGQSPDTIKKRVEGTIARQAAARREKQANESAMATQKQQADINLANTQGQLEMARQKLAGQNQLAVGNQAGQFGLQEQGIRNEGALAASELAGSLDKERTQLAGQNQLAVQGLQNAGTMSVEQQRGIAARNQAATTLAGDLLKAGVVGSPQMTALANTGQAPGQPAIGDLTGIQVPLKPESQIGRFKTRAGAVNSPDELYDSVTGTVASGSGVAQPNAATTGSTKPPEKGAKMGKDGKWYVPNPDGGWKMIVD